LLENIQSYQQKPIPSQRLLHCDFKQYRIMLSCSIGPASHPFKRFLNQLPSTRFPLQPNLSGDLRLTLPCENNSPSFLSFSFWANNNDQVKGPSTMAQHPFRMLFSLLHFFTFNKNAEL
jgi:hypothetical protein